MADRSITKLLLTSPMTTRRGTPNRRNPVEIKSRNKLVTWWIVFCWRSAPTATEYQITGSEY